MSCDRRNWRERYRNAIASRIRSRSRTRIRSRIHDRHPTVRVGRASSQPVRGQRTEDRGLDMKRNRSLYHVLTAIVMTSCLTGQTVLAQVSEARLKELVEAVT